MTYLELRDVVLLIGTVGFVALAAFQLTYMAHEMHGVESTFTDHNIKSYFRNLMLLIVIPCCIWVMFDLREPGARAYALLLLIASYAVSGYAHLPFR